MLAAAGCAGARINVTADRARYLLSLSPVVRDASGRPYDARTLVKVGWLDIRKTTPGFVYSALSIPSDARLLRRDQRPGRRGRRRGGRRPGRLDWRWLRLAQRVSDPERPPRLDRLRPGAVDGRHRPATQYVPVSAPDPVHFGKGLGARFSVGELSRDAGLPLQGVSGRPAPSRSGGYASGYANGSRRAADRAGVLTRIKTLKVPQQMNAAGIRVCPKTR